MAASSSRAGFGTRAWTRTRDFGNSFSESGKSVCLPSLDYLLLFGGDRRVGVSSGVFCLFVLFIVVTIVTSGSIRLLSVLFRDVFCVLFLCTPADYCLFTLLLTM